MNRGLYISATSLIANQKRLESIANNLSNMNTMGYKKDITITESFPEVLLSKINDKPSIRPSGENEIYYQTDGETHTAHTDEGYFMVRTPNGISYVKDIQFVVDDEGYLRTFYRNEKNEYKVDAENYIVGPGGNPVQGQGGDLEGMIQGLVYNPSPRVIGTMSAGVNVKKVVVDFSQGSIVETGGKYDVALNGSGFFKVQGDNGEIYYTRNGAFTVNANGELTTIDGYRVLGQNGPIDIGRGQELNVSMLDVVDLDNKEYLRKVGNNLYQMPEDIEGEEAPFGGEVLQGFLEDSNVDSIKEMVEMINLLRNFESCQKAIRVQDEMLEKSANEIGRV